MAWVLPAKKGTRPAVPKMGIREPTNAKGFQLDSMPTGDPRVIDYEDDFVSIQLSIAFKRSNRLAQSRSEPQNLSKSQKVVTIQSKSNSPGIQVTVHEDGMLITEEVHDTSKVEDATCNNSPEIVIQPENNRTNITRKELADTSNISRQAGMTVDGETPPVVFQLDDGVSTKVSAGTKPKIRRLESNSAPSELTKTKLGTTETYEKLHEIDSNTKAFLKENNKSKLSFFGPLGHHVSVKNNTWGDVLRAVFREKLGCFVVFDENDQSQVESLLAKHNVSGKTISYDWLPPQKASILANEFDLFLKYSLRPEEPSSSYLINALACRVMKKLVYDGHRAILTYLSENEHMIPKSRASVFTGIRKTFKESFEKEEEFLRVASTVPFLECCADECTSPISPSIMLQSRKSSKPTMDSRPRKKAKRTQRKQEMK